ncbi:hypothetical protein IHE45_14G088800 [Dioscorea alata]|uniref:Uncharacterized protein n=1 Tax=Dioscorea alata TaxID=55571 RepID=A0ACB7UTD6_DIOAL|nr:hypothetical protein IHE45_14G088800 [Dioscorea alata]
MELRRHLHQILNPAQCFQKGLLIKRSAKDGPETDDQLVSVELSSVSAVSQEQKDSVVRIVLAGRMVEMYTGAIGARLVMDKYPGLCLARPGIFKNPHDSVVKPTEKLLPGEKFYMIPWTTVNKLRRNQHVMKNKKKMIMKDDQEDEGEEKERVYSSNEKKIMKDDQEDEGEEAESGCSSANEFYVCRKRWALERGREQEMKKEKPFKPPILKVRSTQDCILGGWRPSLPTVREVSP